MGHAKLLRFIWLTGLLILIVAPDTICVFVFLSKTSTASPSFKLDLSISLIKVSAVLVTEETWYRERVL